MLSAKAVLVLFLSGGLGCLARYFMGLGVIQLFGPRFALATLLVNILGCFIFGLVYEVMARHMLSESVRIIVLVGFLGSFTTFSSFIFESYIFATQNMLWLGLNLLGQLGIGFLCMWLGLLLGQTLAPTPCVGS